MLDRLRTESINADPNLMISDLKATTRLSVPTESMNIDGVHHPFDPYDPIFQLNTMPEFNADDDDFECLVCQVPLKFECKKSVK